MLRRNAIQLLWNTKESAADVFPVDAGKPVDEGIFEVVKPDGVGEEPDPGLVLPVGVARGADDCPLIKF